MSKPRLLWQNRVIDATWTAADSNSSYPIENIEDWREYELWAGDGTTNSYPLKADCGSSVTANSIAVCGHNLNTVSARYKLEGSLNDVDWVELLAYSTPGDDFCKAHCFTQVTYRYYRFTIDNNGGANFAPQIGILFIGNYLEMNVKPSVPVDPDGQEDVSSRHRGGTGYLLGTVLDHAIRKNSWSFRTLSKTWVTDYWIPFWNSHRNKPLVWLWDYSNYSSAAYLMWFDNSKMSAPYEGIHRSISFDLVGRKEE